VPTRTSRDVVLAVGLAVAAFLEAVLRSASADMLIAAAITAAVTPALIWRRSHPLVVFLIAAASAQVVALVADADEQLVTSAYHLVFLYALFRWGSGRAMTIGSVVVLAGLIVAAVRQPLPDAIAGVAVAIAALSLGLLFRHRALARERTIERERIRERERLARDLHDTVAHHVSAIAIQAQAGLATAAGNPGAAVEALRVIEGEASRTLTEMRSIVRELRRADEDPRASAQRPDDLLRLAGEHPGGLRVDVQHVGDPAQLTPVISSAMFRIAQEAITNARRHARNATRVDVLLDIAPGEARLSVADDGDPAPVGEPGYGITGMIERATLLGGSCTIAPASVRGRIVTAVLPLREPAR
jgi:signal transduction histidine kinase